MIEKIEAIAKETAERFIRKHFMNLDQKDHLVSIIRNSVIETVKNALLTYESEREPELVSIPPENRFAKSV